MSIPAREAFPLLPEWTALAMYLVLTPFALIFLYGIYRRLRIYGLRNILEFLIRNPGKSLRRLTKYALAQRKVLARKYGGFMHTTIYLGTLILFIGTFLVFLDQDILHFAGIQLLRGTFYLIFEVSLDLFGIILLVGLALAAYRRRVIQPPELENKLQYFLILAGLFYMGITGFIMEGMRLSMIPVEWQEYSFVGTLLGSYFSSTGLVGEIGRAVYASLWWSHAIVAFAMVTYLPYTALSHILSSTLNVTISDPSVSGKLSTPFLLEELMESEDMDVTLGVNFIEGFDWQQRLGLDACTNCGRCEAECPAWAAGTPLSPRVVVQDLKSEVEKVYLREEETSPILNTGIVTEEQNWACTYCGACIQACPVSIDPVEYITEFRRHLTFEGKLGKMKTDTLTNLSTRANPYGLTANRRDELAEELGGPLMKNAGETEYLYWIGCVATYDERSAEIAKAVVKILRSAGVSFALLGSEERCTGDPARRFGEEAAFQELASGNIETFKKYDVKKVLTHCPHCFNTFRNEYPDLDSNIKVVHHAQLIQELLDQGKLSLKKDEVVATLHDACYMGRFNHVYDAPRKVLRHVPGLELVEMERTKERSFCCGAGGCNYWYDVDQEERVSVIRAKEADGTQAELLAVECPFCLPTLEDGAKIEGIDERLTVRDIAEIVADAL